jgi:hypothetical protein
MRSLELNKIPALYLNLEQHVDKKARMEKMLVDCGFETIIRIEGISRPDKPVAGCSAAHYKGLRQVEPPFILFEDDCVLKTFHNRIEIPDDADAIYLGISSWGRMNGHSGPYVQYQKATEDLYRVYNMLGGHAILYLTEDYVKMCQRVAFHAGYIIEDYQDIGFAEIQRWFNVYSFDEPMFYQTSGYHGTVNLLTSYPTEECFSFNKNYFLPEKIK